MVGPAGGAPPPGPAAILMGSPRAGPGRASCVGRRDARKRWALALTPAQLNSVCVCASPPPPRMNRCCQAPARTVANRREEPVRSPVR